MYLLYFLLVEFVQHPVVVLLVSRLVVFEPFDVHGVVEHQKAAFELERADFRQVEQGFFYVL